MSNSTMATAAEFVFIESIDFIVLDCKSGDPNRTTSCIINTVLGAITGLVLPIFIVSGLLFNAFIVYINLVKQQAWTRQNVYISLIALADSGNIFVNGFMWMFLVKGLPWLTNGTVGYVHLNSGDLACRVAKYFEHLCHLTSSALFLLMVSDRALSLYFPFKFQNVTGKAAMKSGAAVVLACIVITIPIGFLYHWVFYEFYVVCYISYDELLPWENTALFYYTTLIYYPPALLLALIFIANCFLIHKVRKIIDSRRTLGLGRAATADDGLVNTVICLILSACLLVSAAPTVFARITEYILMSLNAYTYEQIGILLWGMHDIGMTLIIISQSTNWIVLVWKNVKFRRQLVTIMMCCKTAEDLANNQSNPVS